MILAMAPAKDPATDRMLECAMALSKPFQTAAATDRVLDVPRRFLRLSNGTCDVSAVGSSNDLVMAPRRVSWLDQKTDSS